MKRYLTTLAASGALALGMLSGPAAADEIVIGQMVDRTGPTANVGSSIGPGVQDYVKLINSKGGVEGHTIRLIEVDTGYQVPPAIEGYQRMKAEGVKLVGLFGTPVVQALTADVNKDEIPGTSPGFGSAAATDGKAYPFLFPAAASYWSQAAAGVEYARQQLGGDIKGKKIAYLFYDNPAGREGLPVIQRLAEQEGFTLQEFPVPAPGVEMNTQVRDIARRFRADFIISHLFGRSPSVQIKELKLAGFPLEKVVSFVWGASESDVEAAGGWDAAEGYSGMQFAGVGSDYPVHEEIRAMYKAEGQAAPEVMKQTVFYNRGLLIAALHVEALRNAIKANGGKADVTGAQIREGMRAIKDFSLGGLVPPLNFTEDDHEGGGWVRVFQVKGGKFQPTGDWFRGYRDTVLDMVYKETRK